MQDISGIPPSSNLVQVISGIPSSSNLVQVISGIPSSSNLAQVISGIPSSSNLAQVISGIPRSSNLVQAISGTSISAAVPCWNHQKRLSPVTGASFPAPGRAPISCQSLRLASRAKVRDCYVLTHSRNLHPHSQFGYCLLAHVG